MVPCYAVLVPSFDWNCPPDARERGERVRELVAAHEAGTLSWDDLVDGALAELTPGCREEIFAELPGGLCGRFLRSVIERDPGHWLRWIGDGGAAEDLQLADEDL